MVSCTETQARFCGISIIVLVLLLLGAGSYCAYSLLADYISSPGALCLFVVCFVVFMNRIVQLVVFPGSSKLWRRNIEAHFCRELSARLARRVVDLRRGIEFLYSEDRDRQDFTSHSLKVIQLTRNSFEGLIQTFEELKADGLLRGRQLKLYGHMTELRQTLQDTKLTLKTSTLTVWDWFALDPQETDYKAYQCEDLSSNERGLLAHTRCQQLEAFLSESYSQSSCLTRARRWLFDNTLGNIDQMRIELKKQYKTEGFWVTADDGTAIDCVWFASMEPQNAPTVLFCNPNAGFYEFAFYQNEWLGFYLQNEVNVCMWNYRGYGRSGGRPTVQTLQQDAVMVLKHLRDIRGIMRIGVHGESFGGCVAAYLASQCRVEFVFADRSFWSLDKTAYYGFGRVAQALLGLFSGRSSDSAENFLTASCPKFLSSDPKDTIIHDLSSLKAGVAERLMQRSSKELKSLSEPSLKSLTEAYVRLMQHLVPPMQTQAQRRPKSAKAVNAPGLNQSLSEHQLLSKESEALDDEAYSALMFRVSNALYCLDAGGRPFIHMDASKHTVQSMRSWLLVLEVWGSYLSLSPQELEQARPAAAARLKICAEELQRSVAEYESLASPLVVGVCRDLSVLANCFAKVVSYLEDRLSKATNAPADAREGVDYAKAGYLLPLNCGHAGPLSPPEKSVYEEHLVRIGFLSE
jgi:pimeloyl-ACP methyl ester carboxylesterase